MSKEVVPGEKPGGNLKGKKLKGKKNRD